MGRRPDQVSAIGPCVVGNRIRGRAAAGTIAEQLASHRLIAQSRHAARAASSQVTDRAVGPESYTRRAQHPLAATSPERSVARMEPDVTYKHVLSFAFMVEELLRWLVADRHGMHALVDALDFSTLTRMHEQSVTAGAAALHRHSNDMVWRVHLRERGEDDAVAPAGRADRSTSPPGGDGAQPEGLRAVAVLGGDAGVSIHRGPSDAVAHPQLRGQLLHGALARPAVPLHRPPRAGAAHRALRRQRYAGPPHGGSSTW